MDDCRTTLVMDDCRTTLVMDDCSGQEWYQAWMTAVRRWSWMKAVMDDISKTLVMDKSSHG